jgi:hypothetical protein
MGDVDDEYLDEEEERRSAAVEVVAELQLTAEQIRVRFQHRLCSTFPDICCFWEGLAGGGAYGHCSECVISMGQSEPFNIWREGV